MTGSPESVTATERCKFLKLFDFPNASCDAEEGSLDRIEDCISFLLGKAQQRVMRRAKESLSEHDVTPAQYAALCVLWEQDGRTGAELGGRLVIDSATMTGVIDRLERSSLVERKPDDSDRRIYRLYLTKRGRALQAPLNGVMANLNDEVAELLGRDTERFYRMLRAMGLPK